MTMTAAICLSTAWAPPAIAQFPSLIDRIREEGYASVAEDQPNLFYLTSAGSYCRSPQQYGIRIFGLSYGITLRQQALSSACTLLEMMEATDLVENDIVEARIVAMDRAEAVQVIRIFEQQDGLRNTEWDIELTHRIEPSNPGIRYRLEVAAIAPSGDERLAEARRGHAPVD